MVAVVAEGTISARAELASALERSRADELDQLHKQHTPERHLSLLGAWLAGNFRRTRRALAEPLPDITTGEVGISWIGHASVLIRYSRLSIASDPMLGARLGLVRRAVAPGLTAAEHDDVGLILIGGSEPERLHLPTLRRMPRSATCVVPPRCAALLSTLGFARVVELGLGQSLAHRGVEITSMPVRRAGHGNRGSCAYMVRGDGPSVFVCGGSAYFSGFADIGAHHRPDIALLPIGGYVPRALRADNMSPLDALYAFEDLGARLMIPIGHGTFQLSYETLAEPMAWLRRLVAERRLEDYVTALPAGASRKFT